MDEEEADNPRLRARAPATHGLIIRAIVRLKVLSQNPQIRISDSQGRINALVEYARRITLYLSLSSRVRAMTVAGESRLQVSSAKCSRVTTFPYRKINRTLLFSSLQICTSSSFAESLDAAHRKEFRGGGGLKGILRRRIITRRHLQSGCTRAVVDKQ